MSYADEAIAAARREAEQRRAKLARTKRCPSCGAYNPESIEDHHLHCAEVHS